MPLAAAHRLPPELARELRAAYAAERNVRRRAQEAAGETDQAVIKAREAGATYHSIARLLVPVGTSDTLARRRRMVALLRQRLHKRRRVSAAHAIQPGAATNGFSPTVAGAILLPRRERAVDGTVELRRFHLRLPFPTACQR